MKFKGTKVDSCKSWSIRFVIYFFVVLLAQLGFTQKREIQHTSNRQTNYNRSRNNLKKKNFNFTHSTFRFVLSLHDGIDESKFNWDHVVKVIVPVTAIPRCPICQDEVRVPRVSSCGHYFCFACYLQFKQLGTKVNHCPVCQRFDLSVRCGSFYLSSPLKVGEVMELR